MCEVGENSRILASTPSSTTSGCLSNDEGSDDRLLPSSLAAEELQLALNKEATEEELLKAITRCKDLVLESNQCSLERKWLVRHLIELRLRLQECREAMEDPLHPRNKSSGVSRRTVRGHHLNLQPLLSTSTKYCDHCTGTIWSLVQAWYECEDCGYACHYKCISQIIRECAHVVASERGGYELEICPEEGLSAQKYLCAECQSPLPITAPKGISCLGRLLFPDWSEARKCDYSGLYYCTACHWGSSAVVPARVVHNWDLAPQPVCQASLQQLRVTANRPLLNLEKLNPRLFSLVHELSLVRRLRQELHGMRKYLSVCRNANEDHLLWKHVDVPHLIETPELYSLQDLVDTHSGELPTKLHTIIDVFSKHIKVKCEVCRGRGHLCEICSNDEVLFPFDAAAVICSECNAVLHKSCFGRKSKCPKCLRLQQRKEQQLGDQSEE
ncbi:differentially expressed in FDCP 8 homolog isoform X2 [Tribolium castaneum]|uniref:differentially expressed in FDCP 8 homolog isoform X2 n=1 Tax=Tribolium castaneum TaxID=7070 RepID=UPI00077D9832|nr:PREDICTED: differentially expressed in FDCP 8 homolog isoform X2 [Tribolium castaneum]|eukprot:XP_015833342.1 PREDICTED: differentially expressed in FDCP 8 homolog isoform X2 [Tribolium castaneum]